VSFSVFTRRRLSRPAWVFAAGFFLVLPVLPGLAQQPQSGDSIGARLQRLEAKVQDLQVTVGTLQSLGAARPRASAPLAQEGAGPLAPPSGAADLGPRIDALETQITALASHIEQIGKQMSALEARLAGAMAPASLAPPDVGAPPGQAEAPKSRLETFFSSSEDRDESDEERDGSKSRWYGPNPGSDQVARLIEQQAASEQASPGANAPGAPQNLTPAVPGSQAETLYREGHGALIQKDYASAEGAFRQLIDAYPNDPLAGKAQYWVGETHYARSQYKDAADAFLKAYKNDESGEKAPDALLKLGMALAGLGQKEAACSTFQELKAKYPGAPESIGKEAETWRKKTGC
jgi:tol-pal system protein YbgF